MGITCCVSSCAPRMATIALCVRGPRQDTPQKSRYLDLNPSALERGHILTPRGICAAARLLVKRNNAVSNPDVQISNLICLSPRQLHGHAIPLTGLQVERL
jgi:hypothetical protein